MKRIFYIFLAFFATTAAGSVHAQVKDSTITGIYTDYKSYWETSIASNNEIFPDTSHNLIAFTFRGKTYSTGVDNAILNSKLGNNYSSQIFKALPIKNIAGIVIERGATNLAFAIKNDGDSTKAAYTAPYPTIHIADVLMDGKNGLDLGTGVTNLPKGSHISFPIKNVDTKKTTDAIPDLLFTQIAEPTTNQPDTIFFFDENNELVGNKKLVYWNTVKKLGTYKLDLYTLTPKVACNTSVMDGLFEQNGTRGIRMVAFLITEFGITSDLASKVKGIQINPSGSSDQAFIAYNANTINLDVPVITSQPQTQVLCSTSVKETKFGVSASSKTTPTYQWYKNEKPIPGATSSVFSISNLTLADTANFYNVVVTNTAGSVWSNAAYIKFVIISQPSPATQFLATGNAASFAIKTSGVKTWQWQKDGTNISNATSIAYALALVNHADSGKYTVVVRYDGGTCTSEPAVLKTSVVLHAKYAGDINKPATWGVEADGSGSTPVDFTRDEHTFVLANRNTFETGSDLAIAGTLDLSYCRLTITPKTTLQVGRVTRSSSTVVAASGVIAVSSTANLTLNGIASAAYADTSDLYFDEKNNTIHNLITASHSVTLHNPLNIASGKNSGFLQVNSGDFQTSDLLTLQSDSLGTGSIAKSAGTITGKVTIEKYIHARRAWRLMGAPITNTDAPTINAAWQEGSVSSSDNPHPGYGTHITFGAESDGFDRNPQKTFSMKIRTGSGWVGVPATNKTAITDYPAYFIFVRGDRSYNIATTTNYTKPTSTILRVTGNVYQGAQATKTVAANGLTLVANPYASPVNFAKIISASSNIQTRIRVWDPTLAGVYGVGGWITVDGSTGKYRATPPSANASAILQAGQGFFVESGNNTSTGSVIINEDAKDLTAATINGDRMDDDVTADTSMEINLKVLNPDSSAAIADGVLYIFNAANNNAVDGNDAVKLNNFNENLGIKEGKSILTIDNRTMPNEGDTLKLNFTGAKTATYQLEIVPSSLGRQSFALYDKYLNAFSPLNSTDTTRVTFCVNTSIAGSKAADRFTIIVLKSKMNSGVLPVTFTKVKAYAKEKAILVDWNVASESGILYYEVQKSANGNSFSTAGNVSASGAGAYSFTDAMPAAGMNYYRVKSVGKNGDVRYTDVVNAQVTEAATAGSSAVSVYPNPLTGTTFNLTLTNMEAGSYTLSVINQNGSAVFNKNITHNGGTATRKVTLTKGLSAGVYYIKIASANGTASFVKIAAN